MPIVTDFSDGARFTVRVRSSLASNRRVRWHNTWEVRAISAGGIDDIEAMAGKIATFQSLVCYNYVYIDEATVSSWEEDSHPYNPLGFVTYVYNTLGQNPLGVKLPVSLRQTLFIKRTVVAGLPSKLFLRGALANEDIEYADGEWQLVGTGLIQADIDAAIVTSELEELLLGVEGGQFSLCMIGTGGETRFLTGLQAAATTDVKLNHKYFDRS